MAESNEYEVEKVLKRRTRGGEVRLTILASKLIWLIIFMCIKTNQDIIITVRIFAEMGWLRIILQFMGERE